MNEKKLLNISSGPHVRSSLTTGQVMGDVIVALMPATIWGIIRYGFHAFLVIALSVIFAVGTEYAFNHITKRKQTINDLSAVVTGLLLAISLPPKAPLYLPILGSIFAIAVVKCCFGGLGKNFMNPALTARCFLLISFGTAMTNFSVDGVSSATPLATLASGDAVNVARIYLGTTSGCIGGSALALLVGGLYLWATGGITFEIPVACIVAFTAVMGLFGGAGFAPAFLIAHLCGGGLMMGALFMATDPVTSPVTRMGHLVYGAVIGILAALFRCFGSSADSFSYAIIISNMFVPFIDKLPVPKPLGYKSAQNEPKEFPKAAINLTAITLVAGLALSGVYAMTKDQIAENELQTSLASYAEVCPDATSFGYDDALDAAIEALDGSPYDTASYGKTYVNTAIIGYDDAGNVVGYVLSVSSNDGFEGEITLSVGFTTEGEIIKLSFTTLNETAGMGMRVDEDAFKGQFEGVLTDAFVLIKSGSASADNEIDTVSGASTSSSAVVNAVNTAIDFFQSNIQ